MANMQNQSAGSQVASGAGEYGNGPGAGPGSGESGSRGAHEYIELPEHQGLLIDYIPPRGGLRSEASDSGTDADLDGGDETGGNQAPQW